MLNPQFAHVGELRIADCIGIGLCESRTDILQHVHRGIDAVLFFDRQTVPPFAEFIGELDRPFHGFIMYLLTYIVKGMKRDRFNRHSEQANAHFGRFTQPRPESVHPSQNAIG